MLAAAVTDKYIVRGRRTASRIWGKTAIIVLLPDGKKAMKEDIFTLGLSGTFFWSLLGEKPKIKEIIARFTKKYGIKKENAEKEILSLINKLKKRGIIDILDKL